jgi:hypothetical protein
MSRSDISIEQDHVHRLSERRVRGEIIERVDRLSRPYGVHVQNRDGIGLFHDALAALPGPETAH